MVVALLFLVDATGTHGLIADTKDIGTGGWYIGAVAITTGATAKRIGAGKSNTRKIVLALGNTSRYAVLLCSEYNGEGYKDWFLPSKKELHALYKKQAVVGGFFGARHWSSSEVDASNAWYQFFSSGEQFIVPKEWAAHIRPIRAF